MHCILVLCIVLVQLCAVVKNRLKLLLRLPELLTTAFLHFILLPTTSFFFFRYCRIDEENYCLLFSKTKDQANPTSVDLKEVSDIRAYEKGKGGGKKGVDPQRFNLDMGDGEGGGKVYKFKAKDKAEGESRGAALEDWREFALLTTQY